ncbi:odorant receptor 131-2-like [Clarias gariepinus]|uniref:odorant receptor 131-2-like n=1 Tax=Clarias gariepinus TaxID=13013 RepID=UPI00234C3C13|nr:odorant receptor 131-2-like [Clarias gariepinus]
MPVINESTSEGLLIYQQIIQITVTEGAIFKASFAMLMSLFFIYLNAIMVYTLWSKAVFKDTPRYILFNHMLINDSVQLLVTSLLYVLGFAYLKVVMYACAFLVFLSSTTFRNGPLNLALMSLERYVAISFPLRHAEIATQRRTYIAIGTIWFMGLMHFTIDLLYVVVIEPKFLTSQIFCTRERIFIRQWQLDAFQGFNIFYFVSVSIIMLFTYVEILITTRSISSKKDSTSKAHKTIGLHVIQLSLCLISFFFSFTERAAAMTGSSSLFVDLRYLNYVFLVVLPRCLSPLIYGLRDDALRPLFVYYFCCATGKCRSSVNVH